MASTIRIRRSGSTISPTTLASGEIAYSWAAGAGGKLYLGTGSEIIPGQAPNIDVIGGKFFTDMLDHTPGTLTASSALIADADSKLDQLFIDNISINGNTITTTNTNGNLVFNTNGTGIFDFSSKRLTNVGAPTNANDAVNLQYLTNSFSSTLNISGDTGSDSITLTTETLNFQGGTGISTAVSANNISFSINNTGVLAGTFGNSSSVASFVVNSQGRITSASNVAILIASTQVSDWTEAVQDIAGGMVTGSTQSGIAVTYDDATGKINFNVNDPVITLSGDVAGSATMTDLGNVTITTVIQANSVALGTDTTGNYVASLVQGTGVTITNNSGEGATPTIAIGQNVSPSANVVFSNLSLSGSLSVDGNLTVSGNTFIISTQTLSVQDNLIYLNSASYETIINAVGNGNTVIYTVSDTNTFKVNQSVTVTGITPVQYNIENATIVAANTSTFTVTSTSTGLYSSGGSAEARTAANPDLGFVGAYNDGAYAHTGFFRDASDNRFKVFTGYTPEPDVFIDVSDPSFQLADFQAATFHGSLAGNANSATYATTAGNANAANTATYAVTAGSATYATTAGNANAANTATYATTAGNANAANTATYATTANKLETPRTISITGDISGSTTFDGSANVSIAATIQPNSVVLGTDTTGNYVSLVANTAGSGILVSGAVGEGSTFTISGIDATTTTKGVASFGGWADSANTIRQFSLTSGDVSIINIDGGTF